MHMLNTFPGESWECLVFAARLGCTTFAAWDCGVCVSLAFPAKLFVFHACTTELNCSRSMETSVHSRPQAGNWIPHMSGADTHQKFSRHVQIFNYFFPPTEEKTNCCRQAVALAETIARRLWPILRSQSATYFFAVTVGQGRHTAFSKPQALAFVLCFLTEQSHRRLGIIDSVVHK